MFRARSEPTPTLPVGKATYLHRLGGQPETKPDRMALSLPTNTQVSAAWFADILRAVLATGVGQRNWRGAA